MEARTLLKMLGSDVLRRCLVWLRSGGGPLPPGFPGDPYAWKPAPLKPRPKGRAGSVAVAEPDDPHG
jgi:hypothetical protein